MRILAFTDVHGNKKIIDELIIKSKEADLLICCGDITNLGNNLENILISFKNINKKLIIIPGNHENYEDIKILCRKYNFLVDVHLKKFIMGKIVFFGFGEGGFNYIDKELETEIGKISFNNKDKIIFISHGPPYGTKLDKLEKIGHTGSKSLTKFIKQFKPKLALCGHLHENFGKKDRIIETLIINPGRNGCIIEIEEK